MVNNVLFQLRENEISPKEAYKELYPKGTKTKMRRAHFVKLKIRIPEEKGVNRFLGVLFLLPLPLFLVKFGLRLAKNIDEDTLPMPKDELLRMISYRGIKLSVNAKSGEKIIIKTI
ncbi:MAG: hypothetical protein KJ971_00455 [Firmicutes bacterium]|nr:hypothetical protein [Bacillota bacterium]